MQITIEIPDDLAQSLDQIEGNLSHRLLELIVADAYRYGKINTAEVGQILQLPSRLATHAFLKRMGTYLNYDETELNQDFQTLNQFRAR
jgi:predicted HTH domain antitoxin